MIAGLGTGDRLSEAENRAYGIPFASAAERRAELVELAGALVGAGARRLGRRRDGRARTDEARAAGAALTVWDAEPALVAERASGPDPIEVTWAGPPPGGHRRPGRDAWRPCRASGRRGRCSDGRSTSRS